MDKQLQDALRVFMLEFVGFLMFFYVQGHVPRIMQSLGLTLYIIY